MPDTEDDLEAEILQTEKELVALRRRTTARASTSTRGHLRSGAIGLEALARAAEANLAPREYSAQCPLAQRPPGQDGRLLRAQEERAASGSFSEASLIRSSACAGPRGPEPAR